MSIRVIVADDQAIVRGGLVAILDAEDDIEVVGQAQDGAHALQLMQSQRPDVALLDIRMPRMNGLEAARTALGAAGGGPPTKIIMLTTFDLDEYIVEALRLGASGFLLKDIPPEELAPAIRVVARGDALLAPGITRRVIQEYARHHHVATRTDLLAVLTPRERQVFELLGQGLSNAEIAGALTVAEQTVKTHVGRVFEKLGLRDRAQAVVLAYESGLVVPGGRLSHLWNPD